MNAEKEISVRWITRYFTLKRALLQIWLQCANVNVLIRQHVHSVHLQQAAAEFIET